LLGIPRTYTTDQRIVFDHRFNSGQIGAEECFRNFFGVPISDEQMREVISYWTSTWAPEPEMQDLVARLGSKCRLAILSNSDPLNSRGYTQKGWYGPFDPLILSHEIGILKPDRRIYDILLQRLGLPPEECVFIDDQQPCLDTAAQLGMKTILYSSVQQLEEELKKMGIEF
jgi:putative hydrolase of the HAD superfamily